VPAPYAQNGSHKGNKERNSRAKKVARVSSSGSSVAAAVVEAENDLEAQVTHFISFGVRGSHM
jgi:5'-3' exoribonuclease 2